MPGIRLLDVRAALAALGLAMLAALAVAVVTHLPVAAPAPPNAPATHGSATGLSRVQSLPLQAQSVISSTLGGGNRDFAARRTAFGWGLSGGGVRADFRAGEPMLRLIGGSTLSLSLASVASPTSVIAHGNRVTLVRPGIREWYAAGPLGIEQGFTLPRRPAALASGHQLTLSLAVGGALRARSAGSEVDFLGSRGDIAARYGGLTAVDATGRKLPSALSVSGGRVLIAVDDTGARYPITVDPLVGQGGKLVPNDLQNNGGGTAFGDSVAVSADGNTAIIGAKNDGGGIGAAYVYARTGSNWAKIQRLVPTDELTPPSSEFGSSVTLSADGGTALIGGEDDHGQAGAVWVYTRSGSTWTEQAKLQGGGETGAGQFGHSVALSADGNTALIGGNADNSGNGAFWFFTRSGTTWSPQGSARVPTGAAQPSNVGASVALSSDGNTALIGGPNDNTGEGAVWAYTRSGVTWTQQQEFTANDEAGPPLLSQFGTAVDLSSDGNTAVIGGPDDNTSIGGAAWVFIRSGSIWSQQGGKLVPANPSGGPVAFGRSVAISADGNTALFGADQDASGVGAAYLFTRTGSSWTQQQRLTGSGEGGFGHFGSGVDLAADGQTAIVGAPSDSSELGAAFAFAPPDPVCSSVAATGPQGGGSVAVSLSCTLPSGAQPTFFVLGGPSNGTLSNFNTSTGQLTYTSAQFFSGQDSFTYRVTDQWGISNIATATLTVPFLPVPTCSKVSARAKRGGTRVTITLKCTGPAGHPFTYGIVSSPSNGRLGRINQSNGKVTYRTHIGFSGSDRFVYNATDSGGSSTATTATVVFPRLGRITSTMTWPDFTTGPTSSVVHGLIIKNLPGAAKVRLSCSKGCPIRSRTVALAKHRVCKGKGKKRRCRLVAPKVANLDLTRYVAHARIKVGGKITVAMIQSGSIGKEYVFTMVKNNQPSVKIQTLAPGSTRLCPDC